MKILIINGSPRKQGHISKMLQLMETEARANGDEVTVIRVAEADRRSTSTDNRRSLLLGKPAGTTESDVRPHRLRNDGRDLTRYSYRSA